MCSRAKKLEDVLRVLDFKPLHLSQLDELFEETAEARDPNLSRRTEIANYLQTENNVKVLVTGHPGSGKSTEIAKFQDEQIATYTVISFSMMDEGQLSQASLEALLVLIVEAVTRQVKNLNIKLNDKTLESIYKWFSEAFEIKEQQLEMVLQGGAHADTSQSILGKLIGIGAYLKSDIKTGSNTLHRCVTRENHRLSELVNQVNILVKEARLAVKEKSKRKCF